MIEANDDITLVADRQLRDVELGQAQAKAIAEGREIHPALLAQQSDVPAATEHHEAETRTQSIQPEPVKPPSDPDATFRHIRLGIVALIVVILFFLWLRLRKSN